MRSDSQSTDANAENSSTPFNEKLLKWVKKFGVAGFLFFFIKGLLWLLIPLLISLYYSSG